MAGFLKWIAYGIICFSYLMGMIATSEWLADRTPNYIVGYLAMGLGAFLIGLLLLRGRDLFSTYIFKSKALRTYLFLTIAGPLSYSLFEAWSHGKYQEFANLKDVWLSPGSVGWLDYFLCIAGAAFFFTAGCLFIAGIKEAGKYCASLCAFSFLLTATLVYVTNNDYEAIRTDGIVIQKLGEKEEIGWSEVSHVDIIGYLSRDGASANSTRSFKWEFVFYLKDGTKKVIGPFLYNDYFINGSLEIKKLVMEKKIRMATDKITKEEWQFIKVDMDYEKGNPEDFYAVFQFDPNTGEYYSIPYE
ncbi:hypothetical protein [Neobacillus sp. YIM B06451]|uniref:hypothetical protein n=1 Tax=Neobacillus sp. YIM B06451 TaxID=3070994 RepID=UPI00292DC4E6|nr:hypothetical protein [Neobacillus sp. YIM B06451]